MRAWLRDVFRWAIPALGCAAIWWCLRVARADWYFRQDTPAAVRAAARLIPDQARYYTRLAELEPAQAEPLLRRALSISPYDSFANIDLGLLLEARGDYLEAEKFLLRAFAVDRTYLTRWTLANYYFRRGDLVNFRRWARAAAAMPALEIGPLFELCWRDRPDAEAIAGSVLGADAFTNRQFFDFLLRKRELAGVLAIAPRLVAYGVPESDRARVLALQERFVMAADAAAARSLWDLLRAHGWIAQDQGWPYNPAFARPPLDAGFDWRSASYDGLHASIGSAGLDVEFAGTQPEACSVVEQIVPLSAGLHRLAYRYRTSGIEPATGLHWRILDMRSNAELARSADLSRESAGESSVTFRVPVDDTLVRLRLDYERALGTRRIAGRLALRSAELSLVETGR